MAEEKKKSIFDRIGNLFSNKDELAKTAEAKRKAAELAEQQQKAIKAAADKQAADKMAKARQEAAELAVKQQESIQAEVTKKAEEAKAAAAAKVDEVVQAAKQEAEEVVEKVAFSQAAVVATHTVGANETLSHIALRYYGHATPPYYKLIYEFNKDVIGENMNVIRAGQVLQIPQLPQELVK